MVINRNRKTKGGMVHGRRIELQNLPGYVTVRLAG